MFINSTKKNNQGWYMVVKEQLNEDTLIVSFMMDGVKEALVACNKKQWKSGNVRNPYAPTMQGFGSFGIGNYPSTHDYYRTWQAIFDRVFGSPSRFVKYKECTIGDDFSCYQEFCRWSETQKGSKQIDDNGRKFALDHNLLIEGNTCYAGSTCCYLPQDINTYLGRTQNVKGYSKTKDGKYRAKMSISKVLVDLGTYNTEEEAKCAYKIARKQRLVELANKYSHQLDDYVYQWLVAGMWQVKTTETIH